MTAKKTTWDKNQRKDLSNVLPLTTPLSLNIEASRACNIKCIYCIHSLPDEKLANINFKPLVMSKKLFFKMVDDCKLFDNKVRTIRFAGYGEPLVNKHLPDMIAYTKQWSICEQTVIFTNALLLNNQTSKNLIDAGVDVFRITVQGLCAKDYQKNAGVNIDYKNFLENLRYLYSIKKNCRIFIKILDFAVKGKEDLYYDTFGSFCDEISIEHVIEAYGEVDYDNIIEKENKLIVTGEHEADKVHVCPYPFYMMTVNADGNVSACCKGLYKEFFIGNIINDSLEKIWNNKRMNIIRRFQLKHTRFRHKICTNCNSLNYSVPASDKIDNHREIFMKFYSKENI